MIRMGLSVSSATPTPQSWAPLEIIRGPTPSFRLVAAAASLRCISLSVHKKLSRLCLVSQSRELGFHRASLLRDINFFQFSSDVFASTCLCFFNGGGNKRESFNKAAFRSSLFSGRQWTNVLLGINILVYVAQIATQGQLLLWGAKINSLIDKGQIWRLVTSSVLHANIGHLLINCYSLNSIGPTIEKLTSPRRFIAVYFTAAVASSTTSYFLCKGPSVGASGAIFGLVGSLAMFVIRHRDMIGGGKEDLQQIAKVIFLNMAIGLLSTGIDNWGHLGGLVGGFATSWLIGPAWKFEKLSKDGRRIFVDKAPIKYLANRKKT